MTWQALRARLAERLAPSVRARVRVDVTRYRRAHDAEGRWAVVIDGVQVGGLGCIEAHAAERRELDAMARDTGVRPAEAWPAARRALLHRGEHPVDAFYVTVRECLELSPHDALDRPDALLRSLALLDRRIGKRTLARAASRALPAAMERACLELRLEAEGLRPAAIPGASS